MEAGANPSSASLCPISNGRIWGAAGELGSSASWIGEGPVDGARSQATPPRAGTTCTAQLAHASSVARARPGTQPSSPGIQPALLPLRLRQARAPPQPPGIWRPHRLLCSACQHAGHSGEHLPHGAQQIHAVARAPGHSKGVVRTSPSLLEAP